MRRIAFKQQWDGDFTGDSQDALIAFGPDGIFSSQVEEVWRQDPAIAWLQENNYPSETYVKSTHGIGGSTTVHLDFTVPDEIATYIHLRWPQDQRNISHHAIVAKNFDAIINGWRK